MLLILAAVMVLVMVLTWGSVGSAIMGYGLLMLGAGVLYQKFITNRDEADFQMED